MSVRPNIKRRLDLLDSHTTSLFHQLETTPISQLTQRPSPGYWNALEAVNHIYLGEKLSIQYVKYKLTKPQTIPRWRPDALIRTLVLKWILYSPLKFKSPPQINMRNHQPVLELSQLKDSWQELRSELYDLLVKKEKELRWRLPYKQPYAGRMTLNQMLIFFNDHLVHHSRQIDNILRQIERGSEDRSILKSG